MDVPEKIDENSEVRDHEAKIVEKNCQKSS